MHQDEHLLLPHLGDLYRTALCILTGNAKAAERLVESVYREVSRQHDWRDCPRVCLFHALFRLVRSSSGIRVFRFRLYPPARPATSRPDVLGHLDALPQAFRDAFLLVDCMDLTIEEASRILELDTQALSVHLEEARARLDELTASNSPAITAATC